MTVVNLMFTKFFSAFIDTDDCTPCIDRSFNPEELVEEICHESVDFGKIIEKVTCDYHILLDISREGMHLTRALGAQLP